MGSKQEIIRFLGEGAYGTVDLVKYTRSDGSSFQAAVKSSDDYYSLLKEVLILSELSGYPGIVQCFGNDLEVGFTCSGRKVYKLLLEYASEGSLRTFMENQGKLTDTMIRDFTRMILQGLVSIHGHGYVHCDLKSDNLLVFPLSDDSYELKISDFGNSLEIGEIPDYWEIDFPFVGTPIYMPPESLQDGVAEKTLDLWSLGCIVLEMYTGEKPWSGVEVIDLMPLLLDGNAPEIPESLPCDAREFIETCFARDPEERGSASELLSHRFLRREEKIVVVVEERKNSLRFKELKLRIKRYSNKRKIFPSKSPQIWKSLIKFLRLKNFL